MYIKNKLQEIVNWLAKTKYLIIFGTKIVTLQKYVIFYVLQRILKYIQQFATNRLFLIAAPFHG